MIGLRGKNKNIEDYGFINPLSKKYMGENMSDEKKKQPFKKFRMGNVTATIWENKKDDFASYSVDFQKSYKDQDGEWQNTKSFNINELPKVKLLAELCYTELLLAKGKKKED